MNSYQELNNIITAWIQYCNTKRIEKQLNWLAPAQFRFAYKKTKYKK
ncbi:IS3 family transposase [Lactococcus sp. DD01]